MDRDCGFILYDQSFGDGFEDHSPNLDELQLQSPLSPLGSSEYQALIDSPYFTPITNHMEGKGGRHSPKTVAVHQSKNSPDAHKYNLRGNRQNLRLDIKTVMNMRQKKGPVVGNMDEQFYGKGEIHTQNLQTVASVIGIASSPDHDIVYTDARHGTENSVLLKNFMTGGSLEKNVENSVIRQNSLKVPTGNLVNNRRPIKQATFTNSSPHINTKRSQQVHFVNARVTTENSIIMENSDVNVHNTRVDRDPIIKLHHDNNKRKHDDIYLIRDDDRVVKLHGGKKPHSDPIPAEMMSMSNGIETDLAQQKSVFSTTDSRNDDTNNDQLSLVHIISKNEIQNPDSDQTVYIDPDVSYIPVESTSNDNMVTFEVDFDQLMKDVKDVLECPENIQDLNNSNDGSMNAFMGDEDKNQITLVELPEGTRIQDIVKDEQSVIKMMENSGKKQGNMARYCVNSDGFKQDFDDKGLVSVVDAHGYQGNCSQSADAPISTGALSCDEKLPSISKQMDSLILQDDIEITGEEVIIENPKFPVAISGKDIKSRPPIQHNILNGNQTRTSTNFPISLLDEEPFISYDINSNTLACNLLRDSQEFLQNADDLEILYDSDKEEYNLVGLENIGPETEVWSEREVLRYSVEEGQCADINDGLKQELASMSEDQIPEGVENADAGKQVDLASCIPSTVEDVANLPDFESLVSDDDEGTDRKTDKKDKRKSKEKMPVASKKCGPKSFPAEHNSQPHNLKSFQKPLWEFLLDVLVNKEHNPSVIKWLEHKKGTFKIVKGTELANLWTRARNRTCDLKYEFFARAIRHYYTKNILRRMPHKKLPIPVPPKFKQKHYYTKNILRRMPHKKLQYQFHPDFDWRTYDKKITANATK